MLLYSFEVNGNLTKLNFRIYKYGYENDIMNTTKLDNYYGNARKEENQKPFI